MRTTDSVAPSELRHRVAPSEIYDFDECHRVVIRRDISGEKRGKKVSLLSGGGSGHEPFCPGLVGARLLTAAVCGDIFASPPSTHILAALKAVQSEGGTVIFVINYTGDRLNFGLAMEKWAVQRQRECKKEEEDEKKLIGPIRSVIIGEDTALLSADRSAGRRGLAGSLFVIKIAGAMAEQLIFTVHEIADCAEEVALNCGTIGLSLTSCSLPAERRLLFELTETEMELGLGIHGEPGIKRCQLMTAKQSVHIMLTHMTDEKSANRLKIDKGDNVAVLLNNLGGMSQLEMNILAAEVISWMNNHDIIVRRFYSGTHMTSLEMRGLSVSVLKLKSPHWIAYLDLPTDAPGWPRQNDTCLEDYISPEIKHAPSFHENESINTAFVERDGHEPTVSREIAERLEKCFLEACDALISAESQLNRLDSLVGDGDCGSTFKTMAIALKSASTGWCFHFDCPYLLLQQLSAVVEQNTGGTTGAIYAIMMNAAAKAFIDHVNSMALVEALDSAMKAVMKYGMSQVGDRTMIDALNPTVVSLKNSTEYDKNAFHLAVLACEEGAEKTQYLKAKAGRASYTAVENQNEPDPGAKALSIWIRAFYDTFFS